MQKNLLVLFALAVVSVGCAKSATVRPDEHASQNPTPVESVPAATSDSTKVDGATTPEQTPDRSRADGEKGASALSGAVVYFEYDADTLSQAARTELSTLVEHVRRTGHSGTIVLEGHADERGTEEYNLALGDRRANAVRRYLEQLGLQPSQLRTVSYGENRPAVQGSNDGAWSKNRRVEIVPPQTTASLK